MSRNLRGIAGIDNSLLVENLEIMSANVATFLCDSRRAILENHICGRRADICIRRHVIALTEEIGR